MKKLSQHQINQAMAASNAKAPALIHNGGVAQAVNFAVEDFYKAQMVMKRATKGYTVPYDELAKGLRLFVQQQFFRLNGAGMLLDSLGYQSVTEIMVHIHAEASDYMRATMAEWNRVIESEGDVQRMFEEIAAEEDAQENPPAKMN